MQGNPKSMKTKLRVETVCFLILVTKVHTACNNTQAIYIVPGDVYISGIFNGQSGENCSVPVSLGLQQMAAAVAVTKTFQEISFIPGIKIGISLYEGCSSALMSQKAVISATVENECMETSSLGILTTPDIYMNLQQLTSTLSLSVITTASPYYIPYLFNITTSLLLSLEWTELDFVLANDSLLLDGFEEIATKNLLCIHERQLLSSESEIKIDGTVLIIAESIDFQKMFEEKVITISSDSKLLFLPLNGDLMTLSDKLPSKTYIIFPAFMKNMYDFVPDLNTTGDNTSYGSELLLLNEVQSPIFLQMATNILQITTLFKSNLAIDCPQALKGDGLCPDYVFKKSRVITQPAFSSTALGTFILNLFKIDPIDFEVFKVVKKSLEDESGYRDIGSYKVNKNQWVLNLKDDNSSNIELCRYDPIDNTTGVDCSHCSNFVVVYGKKYAEIREKETVWMAVKWKSEAWVAAILTISVVGILCVLAVAIFIIIRICKQDILEGNPSFTFLMLVSVVFMYISCLPFAFVVLDGYTHYLELFCILKIYGTSLSYSLIFSLMLARCFMIASCDQDGGFMSHINGYLQAVMCFFIVAVQIALGIQFGVLNWKFLTTNQCISMTKGYLFISTLSYNIFLLILLIFTTPFVMKSKRNYHEGSFFAAATLLCVIAWCGWVTAFTLLPEKWHDMVTTCGLCSTATIIVVIVFIPRTYLMMTGIVRDHLASNLPSLAYTSSNSVIDVNYRSTQALYDSVNTISNNKGQLNPNFYSDRPNTPSTSKMDSIQRPDIRTTDSTYERYDTPTSPLNVTRF